MMCPHGFEMLCPHCRAESQSETRRRIESGDWKYAVVQWRGDGKYHVDGALKLYKVKAAAEKYAERLNNTPFHNTVVRLIKIRGNL